LRLGLTAAPFSPDSARLVAAGADGDPRAWDTWTGAEVLAFRTDPVVPGEAVPKDSPPARAVAYSPDGTRVAGARSDGSVAVWDARTGKRLHTLIGHKRIAWSVGFSRDGRRLATTASDGTARLWDVETGAILHVLGGHTGDVFAAAFSPDGTHLV